MRSRTTSSLLKSLLTIIFEDISDVSAILSTPADGRLVTIKLIFISLRSWKYSIIFFALVPEPDANIATRVEMKMGDVEAAFQEAGLRVGVVSGAAEGARACP